MSDFGLLVDTGRSSTAVGSELFSLDLDVTINESHEWTSEVSTNPVEIGSPITDHIREIPDRLVIAGMISDTPLFDSISEQFQGAIDGTSYQPRTQTAFDLLRQLHTDKKLVTVYTKHRVYLNMAIQGINIPRSSGVGQAVNFTIDFMHVRLVSTQSVDVPAGISRKTDKKADAATQKKAAPTVKAGAKQTTTVPEKKSSSVWRGILGS